MIGLGAARLALYLLIGLAFGMSLFAPQPRRWLAGLAVAALLANAIWFALMTAYMLDVPLSGLTAPALATMLDMPAVGLAFLVRSATLLGLIAMAGFRWPGRVLAATALATLAWTGHAAAAPPARLVADIAHLLAGGAWAGAIVSLWLGLVRQHDDIARRAAGFARPGAVIVAVLAVTGVINLVALAGAVPIAHVVAAPWGQLLLAKLALFGVMLALAWRHRTRLVPALQARAPGAAGQLRASLMVEAVLLVGILALVAVAGQLDPEGG